jgi:hypothetical protein
VKRLARLTAPFVFFTFFFAFFVVYVNSFFCFPSVGVLALSLLALLAVKLESMVMVPVLMMGLVGPGVKVPVGLGLVEVPSTGELGGL